jgi:cyclase
MKKVLLVGTFSVLAIGVQAQTPMSPEESMRFLGIDLSAVEIKVQTVAPGIHVLFGSGGNVAVSIGEQGVLVVDDQFPALVPKIKSSIRALGGGDVDFVINTHWHFDHTDGNPLFGAGGSWIVSQANSRQMMLSRQLINLVAAVVEQLPSDQNGLPTITYQDQMQLHFNGEQIDLLHYGPAHTTGDGAVLFRGANVVHMGDVFNNGGYPFIDADNGGELDGVISFCEAVLNQINVDTVVVPGHGPVGGYADLRAYVLMLRTIRERLVAMIADGATLEDVIAANPTAEWDDVKGDSLRLLDRAFASLSQ